MKYDNDGSKTLNHLAIAPLNADVGDCTLNLLTQY